MFVLPTLISRYLSEYEISSNDPQLSTFGCTFPFIFRSSCDVVQFQYAIAGLSNAWPTTLSKVARIEVKVDRELYCIYYGMYKVAPHL